MKTYEISYMWDDKVRITVGPDVICRTNNTSFDGGALSAVFERQIERYESETVAAFNNVRSVRLLDDTVKVEREEYVEDPAEGRPVSPPKMHWVSQ